MKLKIKQIATVLMVFISINVYSGENMEGAGCLSGVNYISGSSIDEELGSLYEYVALDQGEYIVLVKKGVLSKGEALLVKKNIQNLTTINNHTRNVPIGTFLWILCGQYLIHSGIKNKEYGNEISNWNDSVVCCVNGNCA